MHRSRTQWRALMAICVLMALALPRFIYGRPAIDNSRVVSNVLAVARGLSSEGDPDHERKATISSLARGSAWSPSKSREKRQSDQRRAELEALLALSKVSRQMNSRMKNSKLNLTMIGRRRRSTDRIFSKLAPVYRRIGKLKHDGVPA